MPAETEVVDGLICPACGTVERYAGKTCTYNENNSITRIKECKACGAHFQTLEVVIGQIEVKKRKRG